MRKLLITGILLFKMLIVLASDSLEVFNWNPLIEAIAIVESNNNPKAIGKSGCVGLLQITPILVKECNNILKQNGSNKRYILKDRLNPEKSKEMFILIQNKYNPFCDIEKAIRLWNGGPKYSVYKTQKYYNKVIKKLKRN